MFSVDKRIQSTSFILGDWSLSRIFLKNEASYPWFILVPRKDNIQEIYQLARQERELLMEEINQLSLIINEHFDTDKLNIGALGNVVSQLHVHVIARHNTDPLWPEGVWRSSLDSVPYSEERLNNLVPFLQDLIKTKEKEFL